MLKVSFWLGFLLSACIAAGQTDVAPDLILSADTVSGSGSVGTTITLPSVSLTSSNSTPIRLSVVSQRSDGAGPNWLVATLTSSTTPATLNISANLQGFVPGTYLGKLFVYPLSPTTVGAQVIDVTLDAQGTDALQISMTPNVNQSIEFNYPTVVNGSIQLTSSSTTHPGLYYNVKTTILTPGNVTWLKVTQNGTRTPGSLTVSAERGDLPPSTYFATIEFRDSNNNLTTVPVAFVVPQLPTLSAVCNGCSGTGVTGQNLNIGSIDVRNSASVQPISFNVTTSTNNSVGPSWLHASVSTGTSPASVSLSANLAGLAQGTYSGSVTITPINPVSNGPVILNATATVRNGALQVTWTTGQQPSQGPDQVMALTSPSSLNGIINVSGGTDTLFYGYSIKSGASWLTASPAAVVPPGVQTPGAINITASANGLSPSAQPYQGRIDVFDSANNVTSVNITLLVTGDSSTTNQTISHIAYGGGWQTSIVLVNLDTVPAPYTVNFWSDAGTLATVPLGVGSASTGTIQPGFSQTIETAALSTDPLREGWAEVVSSQQIGGTAIFSETRSHQEAAVPFLNTGSIKLLIPFDVGGPFALGIGLANPSLDTDAQISLTMRTEQGNTIPMTITDANNNFSLTAVPSLALARHSHRAILAKPLTATGEVRGVIELNSNVPVYALGIRFNGLAFTSIDSVTPSPAATKTISHLAFGGGWQTTIIPVNTDPFMAPYSINFWNEDGTPAAVPLTGGAIPAGTIQPGFSQTIETAALPTDLLREGWAELSSTRQIGGTAIFRQTQTNQEAAVPLLSSGSTKLLIPFDVGGAMALGIGLANPDPSNDAQITLTMRTEQGTTIPMTITDVNNNFSPTAVTSFSLARRSHRAILAKPLNSTGEVRGVIELNANVPIDALGIRFNGLAFTSIRALGK